MWTGCPQKRRGSRHRRTNINRRYGETRPWSAAGVRGGGGWEEGARFTLLDPPHVYSKPNPTRGKNHERTGRQRKTKYAVQEDTTSSLGKGNASADAFSLRELTRGGNMQRTWSNSQMGFENVDVEPTPPPKTRDICVPAAFPFKGKALTQIWSFNENIHATRVVALSQEIEWIPRARDTDYPDNKGWTIWLLREGLGDFRI